MLRSAMTDISKSRDVYRTLFEAAPNDGFSVAEFCPGNEGTGSVYAVLLEKPVDLPAAAALSLLWARHFIFYEEWDLDTSKTMEDIWEYALSGDYMHNDFRSFLTQGVFSPMAPSIGKTKIERHLREVRFEHCSEQKKPYQSYAERYRGRITSPKDFHDRLTGFDYLQAFQIADEWNDQSTFFETSANFGYVSWGTSA